MCSSDLNGIMVGSLFVYSINFYFNYNIKSFEHFIFLVIIVNFISKIIYWISINKNTSKTSTQTAIGLKGKEISFFEGPHTGKNYLTTEMINTIKKSNANFLRLVFCILSFITPIYAIYSYKTLIVDPLILKLSMIIVFFLAIVGMIIERYLFFSHAFICNSVYEGFNNNIVHALNMGLAVISKDCDFGPREILKNKEYGLLVENNKQMKEEILLQNYKDKIFNKSAFKRSLDFSVKSSSQNFLKIIDEC